MSSKSEQDGDGDDDDNASVRNVERHVSNVSLWPFLGDKEDWVGDRRHRQLMGGM